MKYVHTLRTGRHKRQADITIVSVYNGGLERRFDFGRESAFCSDLCVCHIELYLMHVRIGVRCIH